MSRRFEQLARTSLFKSIRMDSMKPSRMPILAWILTRNPSLLVACRSLHLRMCECHLTIDYPRIPTTRDQDESQKQIITSIPNLQEITIWIGHFHEEPYPRSSATRPLGQFGFARTLDALSKCSSLRSLTLTGQIRGSIRPFLLDLFICVGERLERLSIQDDISDPLLRSVSSADTSLSFPVLGQLLHLSFQCSLFDMGNLYTFLSKHTQKLATLVCICGSMRLEMDEDKLVMPTMRTLACLSIYLISSINTWMVLIPTKQMQLGILHVCLPEIVNKLATFIRTKRGVFAWRCVETIQLTIDRTRPGHSWYEPTSERGEDEGAIQEALKPLRTVCNQNEISLVTIFIDTIDS